ncbi:MAG: hypothetical protein IJH39_00765 [Clostridia bacterium]|nr:hypothetical protein [Clostridia bacterium]
MEINSLNIEKNLNNNLIEVSDQNNFLQSVLGKTINTAIDIGLRAALPDLIENQVINIKDNMLNYGLKDGVNKTIEDAINLGKSAIGIVTGNFDNISQMQDAVKSGGIIDGVSTLIDTVLNQMQNAGVINKNISTAIKQGKNIILNNVENNIQKTFSDQLKNIENLDKDISNWQKAFTERDFNSMEKSYKKVIVELKNIVPIEKTISKARTIENLHNLIKSNGKNFDLTEEEIELANKLK